MIRFYLMALLCLCLTGCQNGCARWESQENIKSQEVTRERRTGVEQGQQTDLVITRVTSTDTTAMLEGSATITTPNVSGVADILGGGGLAGLLTGLAAMAIREFSRRGTDKEKQRRMEELEKDRDEGWDLALKDINGTPTPSKPDSREHA